MTPEDLKNIAHEINTQDNRITADPLFCVFQKRRIYGIDEDCHDFYIFTDEDGSEIPCIDVDEFVNAHFTEKAANEHIRINGHNLKKPFIFVTSLFRCEEMIKIRKALKNKEFLERIGKEMPEEVG